VLNNNFEHRLWHSKVACFELSFEFGIFVYALIYCTVDTETAHFAGGTELGLKLTGLLRADIFVRALCEVRGLSKIFPEIVR